jgi:hypothetical protein
MCQSIKDSGGKCDDEKAMLKALRNYNPKFGLYKDFPLMYYRWWNSVSVHE